jgi:hypothetical protein
MGPNGPSRIRKGCEFKRMLGVGGGIRTHDSRSHSPEFYH